MLDSLFRTPIELDLEGQALRFDSEADFAFAIEGRTDVTGEESARLMSLTPQELAEEIARARDEVHALGEELGSVLSSPDDLRRRLADIERDRWRREHDWHVLMDAVTGLSPSAHGLQRTAVLSYLGYLRCRVDVMNAIVDARERAGRGTGDHGVTSAIEAPVFDADATTDEPAAPASGARRLPRGKAVPVLDPDAHAAELLFSQHRHRIRREANSLILEDDSGKRCSIPRGLSCVGRDPSCDIALRGVLRDVSRAHAMFELDTDGRLWVTDISSRGTFVLDEDARESEG